MQRNFFFLSPMVSVESQGGALVQQVMQVLQGAIKRVEPGIILVHAGMNNVAKTYLYRSEYHQLQSAEGEIENLVSKLAEFLKIFPKVKVILSSVTATRDVSTDRKANVMNEQLRQHCERRKCFL